MSENLTARQARIKELYERGLTLTEIERATGWDHSNVRQTLVKIGVFVSGRDKARGGVDYYIQSLDDHGYEYVGGFENTAGSVLIRCKKCGHQREVSCATVRSWKGGFYNSSCPGCAEIERNRRERRRESEQVAKQMKRDTITGTQMKIKLSVSKEARDQVREMRRRIRRGVGSNAQIVDKDISLKKVYERDGGICHICGGLCDWDDSEWKNEVFVVGRLYPTIDHVIPIARGGKHEWSNVRLAHLSCNSQKGARKVQDA